MLKNVFRKALKYNEQKAVGEKDIVELLDQEEESFHNLPNTPVSRSFVKNPSPDATHVLRQALVLKSIPRDLRRPGLQECYVMGWLDSEAVDVSASQVVLVYPTRLHAKFVERYYTTSTVPFPIKKNTRSSSALCRSLTTVLD